MKVPGTSAMFERIVFESAEAAEEYKAHAGGQYVMWYLVVAQDYGRNDSRNVSNLDAFRLTERYIHRDIVPIWREIGGTRIEMFEVPGYNLGVYPCTRYEVYVVF